MMANYKQHCIKLLQLIDTNWPAGLPTTWEKWANAARADLTNSEPLKPMTNQHPITPPPELVEQWCNKWTYAQGACSIYLATQAARWGADQELEACCEWVEDECPGYGRPYEKLRSARRPKPLSLKERALAALDEAQAEMSSVNYKTIRAVLEQLDD